MDTIPISIIVPGIRHHLWDRFISSVEESCKKNKWEIIFITPFIDKVPEHPCVKGVQSYAKVPVCLHLGWLHSTHKYPLMCHIVDDAVLLPNALDAAISQMYWSCSVSSRSPHFSDNDFVYNMLYSEGPQFTGHFRTEEDWKVENCPEFHLPYIKSHWSTTVQPLMYKLTYERVGGIDCVFEYSNHSHHDLMFRIQQNGGRVFHTILPVSRADHMPERTGDHAPIHDAQMNDVARFNEIWSKPRKTILEIDHYGHYNIPWERRFGNNTPSSYDELAREQGYDV